MGYNSQLLFSWRLVFIPWSSLFLTHELLSVSDFCGNIEANGSEFLENLKEMINNNNNNNNMLIVQYPMRFSRPPRSISNF